MDRPAVESLLHRLPDVDSAPHFDRTAWKCGGKIFATLGDDDTINLRLTPETQHEIVALTPAAEAIANAWGRQGWTALRFQETDDGDLVAEWLATAWRLRAGKRLLAEHPDV